MNTNDIIAAAIAIADAETMASFREAMASFEEARASFEKAKKAWEADPTAEAAIRLMADTNEAVDASHRALVSASDVADELPRREGDAFYEAIARLVEVPSGEYLYEAERVANAAQEAKRRAALGAKGRAEEDARRAEIRAWRDAERRARVARLEREDYLRDWVRGGWCKD